MFIKTHKHSSAINLEMLWGMNLGTLDELDQGTIGVSQLDLLRCKLAKRNDLRNGSECRADIGPHFPQMLLCCSMEIESKQPRWHLCEPRHCVSRSQIPRGLPVGPFTLSLCCGCSATAWPLVFRCVCIACASGAVLCISRVDVAMRGLKGMCYLSNVWFERGAPPTSQ